MTQLPSSGLVKGQKPSFMAGFSAFSIQKNRLGLEAPPCVISWDVLQFHLYPENSKKKCVEIENWWFFLEIIGVGYKKFC